MSFPDGQPPDSAGPKRVDDLIDSRLMARLDHLDVVSRKIFNGRPGGTSQQAARPERGVRGLPPLRGGGRPAARRLEHLRPARPALPQIFLEEEDLSLIVAIDASASMHWGDPPKFDFARRLAMALGYIGLVNQNRVTLAAFGGLDEAGSPGQRLANLRGRRRTHEAGKWLLGLRPGGATSSRRR